MYVCVCVCIWVCMCVYVCVCMCSPTCKMRKRGVNLNLLYKLILRWGYYITYSHYVYHIEVLNTGQAHACIHLHCMYFWVIYLISSKFYSSNFFKNDVCVWYACLRISMLAYMLELVGICENVRRSGDIWRLTGLLPITVTGPGSKACWYGWPSDILQESSLSLRPEGWDYKEHHDYLAFVWILIPCFWVKWFVYRAIFQS
jgi:FlaA1/EpsC-like NDP-sugar epimerase